MINKLAPQDIKRYNWYIWRFFIGCFAFVVILIGLTTFGAFGTLPSLRDLENPKSDQASEIISADKQVIGKYYFKNRSSVNFRDISPNVINALIAKEDNHFYSHSGIDFWRTFSIIPYNLIGRKQGASTLTQQLALNLFSDHARAHNPLKRVIQKLQELIIAVRIEKHYTKQEIITMYLNTVDFGSNTFGIASAAQTYFNTTPAKLTADQAATLIQMLTAPTKNSPVRHPDRALNNRNFVLNRMASEGFISDGQAAEYKAKPLGIDYHQVDHNEGLAPYFRSVLRDDVKRILSTVNKADGTPYDIDRDGLKIYTTINASMQQYAEDAQREWMRKLQNQFNTQWKGVRLASKIKNYKLLIDQGIHQSDRYRELKADGLSDEEIADNFNTPDTLNLFTWRGNIDTIMKPVDSVIYCKMLLRNALMSMDPTTGYVKAWVGGINFEHFKYDQVKQGARQVGSTAKPFTYAVAIGNGYSPCFQVNNVPITISGYGGQDWKPGSSPLETLPGMITLRAALAHSQNWVTAYIMNEVKPEPVAELIKRMGIHNDVPPYPSICLGVFDATVMDMTAAYSVFANHGIWTEPTYLLRIEDKNGNEIYSYTPKVKQVMNEQNAYVMVDMLKSVVDMKGATGNRLRWMFNFTNPIAGKTGTTSDNSDGWFIGVTPKLVTGVWTGCENRDFHFRTTAMGEGSNSALPIFALYLKKVYADESLGIKKNIDFELPKNGLTTVLDCDLYSQQQKGTNEIEKKLSF
ncbi:penicillin-binding protein 1A [Mucilaginibacter sp. UR6-11]|uniref:penicillin-binding protein 1A n=1 Tax=Mucilaginibacter sp. UR6-11 TaxID=1435644 RepID=UPI001E4976FD|nr:transglycosylase domain-containing protein [Mucilaginibacter sp. UR6-11]MCC8425130.1 transglycosylase domain-containing protein [Mucilaginibacter sp. UR6-11]